MRLGRNAHLTPADRAGGPGPGARDPEGARREDRQDSGRPRLRRHARRAGGALRATCRCRWSRSRGRRPRLPETEGLAARFMRQCRFLPVALQDSTLTIAMADPLDFETVAAVRGFTGLQGRSRCWPPSRRSSTPSTSTTARRRRTRRAELHGDAAEASEDLEHLRDMASEAPVIRLVNAMIAQARREARQRHPHRAVREGVPHPLPRGRRALQPGAAAARIEGRHHLAREADGEAEHRRAPPAAGRAHQDQDAGPRGGPARLDAAHALRRKRRDAPARPLGGRLLRPAAARLRRAHARRAWSTSPRCRTASSW